MNFEANLTNREMIISEYIAWGASKKEIADKLSLSVRTIENHSRNIFEKLDIQKSTELSVYWFCKNYNISLQNSPCDFVNQKLELHFVIEISIINFQFTKVIFSKVVKPYTNIVENIKGCMGWKKHKYTI